MEYPDLLAVVVACVAVGLALVAEAGDKAIGLGQLHSLRAVVQLAKHLLVDEFLHIGIGDAEVVAKR